MSIADVDDTTIGAAYDLIPHSYAWTLQRFEAIHNRLQSAIALTATIPVFAITIIKSLEPKVSLESYLFILAVGLLFVSMLVGIVTLYCDGLTVLRFKTLHDHYLDLSPSEFSKDVFRHASRHQERNIKIILVKSRIAAGLMAVLVLALVLLASWAITPA